MQEEEEEELQPQDAGVPLETAEVGLSVSFVCMYS